MQLLVMLQQCLAILRVRNLEHRDAFDLRHFGGGLSGQGFGHGLGCGFEVMDDLGQAAGGIAHGDCFWQVDRLDELDIW